MRALSTKVLGQSDGARKKIYPVNYMEDDADEINYAGEEEMDEDSILMALLEEGDESALVIQEFEDSIVQVCQDSPELSMASSAYQEARAKIRDKVRGRGFWPIRSFPKGKGRPRRARTSSRSDRASPRGLLPPTAGSAEFEAIGKKNVLKKIDKVVRKPTCLRRWRSS